MIWTAGIGLFAVALIGLALLTRDRARRAEQRYPPVGAFVTVEGVRLHYLRKGVGPAVVLLHGSDGFLQDFSPELVDGLAVDHTVIVFDRPGHGYSEAPEREAALPQTQARLIRGALRQLGIARPLLVGHSWAGLLLMVYALEYPDEAAGLTLLAPWVYPPHRPPFPLLYVPRIPLLGKLISGTVLTLVKGALVWESLWQAFLPDPVPVAYRRLANALWQRRAFQTQVFAEENTRDRAVMRAYQSRYSDVRIPVVIVNGECDRIVDPVQHGERLARILPCAERIVLPATGHELPQARPEAVLRAVQRCTEMAALRPLPEGVENVAVMPADDVARARALVFRYGWNPTSYQILNPQMERWFAPEGEAVVGFVRRFRFRIVAGAPICEAARLAEVVTAFEQEATRVGERVCYFGAADRLRAVLASLPGHTGFVIGAQPIWHPSHWPAILGRNASLRAQLNRARNKQVAVAEWPVARASDHPELQRCLESWLETRAMPTLQFLTEPIGLDRLADRRIFVAVQQETPIGYLIATPVPDRNGWLIEQIVREQSAPNGTAELLVDAALRALAADDYHYVTLGLAPLSHRASPAEARSVPWLRLLLGWVRAHGRRFYNFEGLDSFKGKFRPDAWEPIYAISNESRITFRALFAMAAAFSGDHPVVAVTRALLAALRQEIAWMRERLHARQTPPAGKHN